MASETVTRQIGGLFRFAFAAALLLLTACVTPTSAHSPLDTTTPEDGAELAEHPTEISFQFAKEIRLTRVHMTYQDHPSVRLDLSTQTGFARTFVLPLIDMGQGSYRIEWRGLSVDGHIMRGQFVFTVDR